MRPKGRGTPMAGTFIAVLIFAIAFVCINFLVRSGFGLDVSFGADAALALSVYDFSMVFDSKNFSDAIPDPLFKSNPLPCLMVYGVLSLVLYLALVYVEVLNHQLPPPAQTLVERLIDLFYPSVVKLSGLAIFLFAILAHIAPWLGWISRPPI